MRWQPGICGGFCWLYPSLPFAIPKRRARHLQACRAALWAAPRSGVFPPPAPVAGNAWRRGGQRLSSSQMRMAALVHARTYVKLSLR